MENNEYKFTNSLINESSPYLLQHAHNPVNWHAWNEETLKKAKDENKMILVSIGYSACHWCHVMEHESFEDTAVANVMNEHFICIKVDREERPDVDQVYMDAVQAVSGRGGWPLNCFALPDGRPFWGGTYFPKDQWVEILLNVDKLFRTQYENLEQQAANITEGLTKNQFLNEKIAGEVLFTPETTDDMVNVMAGRFDKKNGGSNGAPKFPMPNNYLFLLESYAYSKNDNILDHLNLTLAKMAEGGIYDQVGGGFARYSVDERWHVPHFEKMLYDNAQLVSLYSKAYQQTKNPYYRQVLEETLEFVKRELTGPDGGFYSALDADSDGEEGKFYVWTTDEIRQLIPENTDLVIEYFGIDKDALWENGNNVLIKAAEITDLAKKYSMSLDKVESIIRDTKHKLLAERAKRVRPGLDDKMLTSWNALMINAYVDASFVTEENEYLDIAISNGKLLLRNLRKSDGGLFHSYKHGKATIDGFLEDYAFVMEAFINLYQATADESWLYETKSLADYTFDHFYDEPSKMFYFTSNDSKDLITRKIDVTDNVIPAANSSLANSLLKLSLLFEETRYRKASEEMLKNVLDNLSKYPTAFSNWGILYLKLAYSYSTVVIAGPEAKKRAKELQARFLPNVLFAYATNKSELPVFESRFKDNETIIYVCLGSECKLPVYSTEEALLLIFENN